MNSDESNPESPNDRPPTRSKVQRVIGDYKLGEIGDELERRWRGEGVPRMSLRELADYLNKIILQQQVEHTNDLAVDGEIENLYRLLTGDDVAASDRTHAESKLSRMGIDIESLQEDFVSHQAVHTYLTKVRGANFDTSQISSLDTLDNRKNSIQKLRNRLIAMSESNIQNLRNTNRLSIGTFDVTASVTVHCSACGKSFDITELFDKGHCAC